MKWPGPILPVHLQHLVEVAIEDFAGPTDAYRVATHQARDRRRIEIVDQQLHVLFQFMGTTKVRSKTAIGRLVMV